MEMVKIIKMNQEIQKAKELLESKGYELKDINKDINKDFKIIQIISHLGNLDEYPTIIGLSDTGYIYYWDSESWDIY